MYSDGLIERRGELITDGMERLADRRNRDCADRDGRTGPRSTFASMLSADERTDDVVVLCLNFTGVTEEGITCTARGYDT